MTINTHTANNVHQQLETLQQRVAELEAQVADSKRIQDALYEREELLHLFVEHTPAAVAMFDTEVRYILASQRWIRDYGLSEREITGYSHYEIFPDIPDRWKEIHRRCLHGAVERCEEDPFPRDDGTTDWITWEVRPWYRPNGAIGGIIMFTEVLTRQKQSERALHQSQQMLQLIVDNLPGAVFWKDTNLVYQGCNESFAIDAGVGAPQNIVGKTDYDLPWAHTHAESFRTYDRRIIDTNTPEYHIIEQQFQADGKEAWLDTNKIPLHDIDGSVIGVMGTYEDITERKQMEEALRANEQKFRNLIENIAAPVFIHQGSSMVYVNSAASTLTGYGYDGLLSMNFWEIVHPQFQDLVRERATARQRGEVVDPNYEIQIITSSGEERWVDITANFTELDSKASIVITGFDITERKREEEERIQTQQTIIQAQRDTLRELATPLIPINERMLIMPLIGQIDEDRAQQIMETLLNGIAQSGTQIAILDITGVPFVDTQVAAGLIATTQAVRLLGAQVILSGIRPDVAETLVKLDITLAGVITHSNLQTAVVHAMRANAVSAPR